MKRDSQKNVKPGDRAIVVRAKNPQNIGKIVVVVCEHVDRSAPPGWPRSATIRRKDGETYWQIESLGGLLTMCDDWGNVRSFSVAVVADSNLRKLEPPEDESTNLGESSPVKDSLAVEEKCS